MPRPLARFLGVLAFAAATVACARSDARSAAQTSASAGVVATPAPSAGKPGALTDSVSTAADRGRIRGAESAPVGLVEVSDFQCPYCKKWHDESFALLDKEYVQTGKVRLAYLNYPLTSIHRNAQAAAEAAMCASVQGKFWPLHQSLFETQLRWQAMDNPVTTFDSLAVAAGANQAAWRQCMTSHATAALIDADRDRTSASGVRSTPTFFIGDRKLEGAYPVDSFRVAIDAAIAKARGGK
ncbi:MAG TPA: thioredoxin domain-containing protein [Gemmatimonadaceae bacterium]|nr:thioredoxin domain-containing protein [Gemmatimonadaceae bacterium]